jgi:hypothetical protein
MAKKAAPVSTTNIPVTITLEDGSVRYGVATGTHSIHVDAGSVLECYVPTSVKDGETIYRLDRTEPK